MTHLDPDRDDWDRLARTLDDDRFRTRYAMPRKLATGSFSLVLGARRKDTHAEVAIKVLRPSLAGSRIAREMFAAEPILLGIAASPWTLAVVDVGAFADLPYFASPLCRDGTLDASMRPADARAALHAIALLTDAVRGLARLHARGIAALDLAPKNIFVDGEHAYLGDLGGAAVFDAEAAIGPTPRVRRTPTAPTVLSERDVVAVIESTKRIHRDHVIATWSYAGREHVRREISPAPDLVSAGLALYELVCGHHPYRELALPEGDFAALAGLDPRAIPSTAATAARHGGTLRFARVGAVADATVHREIRSAAELVRRLDDALLADRACLPSSASPPRTARLPALDTRATSRLELIERFLATPWYRCFTRADLRRRLRAARLAS